MALFSGIKDAYKKSEAVVIIEDCFNQIKETPLWPERGANSSTNQLANILVNGAWAYKPDMLGGSFGNRPHKLALAAFALARGVERMDIDYDFRQVAGLALAMIMDEVAKNGRLYSFNNIDAFIFEGAFKLLDKELADAPRF